MFKQASKGARLVALVVIAAMLAGCLPRSGPTRGQIFAGSVQRQGDAFVVEVNSRVTRATSVTEALGFPGEFTHAGLTNTDIIQPGDTIALTVYENVEDGLLTGQAGNATIQEIQVDGTGNIFVPYAGRIRAAGNTPDQLREILTRNLDEQTPDPQVIVRREAGDGSTVSVAGAIGAQGVFPIEPSTAHCLIFDFISGV